MSKESISIKKIKNNKNQEMLWTSILLLAYLGLYTAYDKSTKALDIDTLLDVLLARKGFDHTLVQLNKVISLVGLTLLGLPFTPFISSLITDTRTELTEACYLLSIHSMYSTYKYYGSKNIPEIQRFVTILEDNVSSNSATNLEGKRKISLICGACAATFLDAFYFEMLPINPLLVASMLVFGLVHFYYMEIDFRGSLQVRPFGYLAFVVPSIALMFMWFK